MDRVLPSEGRGCWFDPSRTHQILAMKKGSLDTEEPFFSLCLDRGREPRLGLQGKWITLTGMVDTP